MVANWEPVNGCAVSFSASCNRRWSRRHGDARSKEKSQKSHARKETRRVTEWVGKEGEEPKASNCNRNVRVWPVQKAQAQDKVTDIFAHIGARWRLLIGRRDRRPMQIQALILRYAVKPARNCMLTAQGSVRKEWLGEVSSTPEHVDLA